MKSIVAVIGIVLLLIGVGLVVYGISSPVSTTTPKTTTLDVPLTPMTTRPIDANGVWSPGGIVLSNGETVKGTFTISNYSSSAGPIFLYIQNQSQFIAWGACAPCTSSSLENWTLPSSGTYTFTWSAPRNGSYYMSFDDESYGDVAPAVYSANGTTTQTTNIVTTSPNTMLIDAGAGLIVVGAVVIAVGVIMGGQSKSVTPPKPTTPESPPKTS